LLKPVFVGSVGEALKSLAGFSGKPKTINRQLETYLEVCLGAARIPPPYSLHHFRDVMANE
jgi:hypothetical protein